MTTGNTSTAADLGTETLPHTDTPPAAAAKAPPAEKTLPLGDIHAAAGARFGSFAGWSMPITYPAGVMREHQHTREQAGLFDISHMQLLAISGPDAEKLLARACPIEPQSIASSQSKLTFL